MEKGRDENISWLVATFCLIFFFSTTDFFLRGWVNNDGNRWLSLMPQNATWANPLWFLTGHPPPWAVSFVASCPMNINILKIPATFIPRPRDLGRLWEDVGFGTLTPSPWLLCVLRDHTKVRVEAENPRQRHQHEKRERRQDPWGKVREWRKAGTFPLKFECEIIGKRAQ